MGVSLCSPTCSFGPKTKVVIDTSIKGMEIYFYSFSPQSKDKCYSSKVGVKNLLMGKKLLNLCVLPSPFNLNIYTFHFR